MYYKNYLVKTLKTVKDQEILSVEGRAIVRGKKKEKFINTRPAHPTSGI